LDALFGAHRIRSGVGLVQRFHVVFCAETPPSGRWTGSPTPTWRRGINLGLAITTFCRRGVETRDFHKADPGH
jgi:hypothetical protein